MFSNQSAELSLNSPCKAVAAVWADRSESRFLVGTCSVQDNDSNQLHVIRYHSDVNVVGVDASLTHPTGPIQHLVTNPNDRNFVVTLAEQATTATLYKLPTNIMELTSELSMMDSETTHTDYGLGDYNHNDSQTADSMNNSMYSTNSASTTGGGGMLEQKATLESTSLTAQLLDVQWRNGNSVYDDTMSSTAGDVVTLDATGTITQWDLSMGMAESMHDVTGDNAPLPPIARPRIAWDPHHGSSLAVSWGRGIRFVDLRSSSTTAARSSSSTGSDNNGSSNIARAHRYGVTDMDYNPNKPFTLATSGLEGIVHYWDTRSTRKPLLSARGGHSHYAWRVQYNPFHDQLVLSTGTDAVVNLWRVSTISSAPLLTMEDTTVGGHASSMKRSSSDGDESETSAPNVRVARHEQTESVYGATWGAADAWMYMTLAYDGKVALHHVPSKEKYKILL